MALNVTASSPGWGGDADGVTIRHPRAIAVWQAFSAKRRRRLDDVSWRAAAGPWAGYLDVPFQHGLSGRERRLFETAVRNGQCHTVEALQTIGFLQLYPELQPVHARAGVTDVFTRTVLRPGADGRYCRARARLLLALAVIRTGKLNVPRPLDIAHASSPALRGASLTTPADRARNSLCQAVSELSDLALGDDVPTAMRDLLDLSDRDGIIRLPGETDFYLRRRARQLRITAETPGGDVDPAYHRVKPEQRIRIARYAETHAGPAPLSTRWICPLPMLDPFDVE